MEIARAGKFYMVWEATVEEHGMYTVYEDDGSKEGDIKMSAFWQPDTQWIVSDWYYVFGCEIADESDAVLTAWTNVIDGSQQAYQDKREAQEWANYLAIAE
jgi:hypothetical protein